MENVPSLKAVVGKIPEEEKVKILAEKGDLFESQILEDFKFKEMPKSSEELEIIALVNDATNEVGRKYGLKDFDVPSKNIHVVSREEWPLGNAGARYSSGLQASIMREEKRKLVFMEKVFHEMLHFKSYNSLQITTGEKPTLKDYRTGLTMKTRNGEDIYFTNLNEAVTEELLKRYIPKVFEAPIAMVERKQTTDIIARYPNAVSASGEPLFDDDTYYASVEGGMPNDPNKLVDIHTSTFTYKPERKMLNTLIAKILEKNSGIFADTEAVFELFAKGMMTGDLSTFGRLIDKSFSPGTLRQIGQLNEDIAAQQAFVQDLK
jgi:hypothetical protein